jgi:hypothetical protein
MLAPFFAPFEGVVSTVLVIGFLIYGVVKLAHQLPGQRRRERQRRERCWRSRKVQRADHEKCRALAQIIGDPFSLSS